MTAPPPSPGDRVRLVTETSPLDERYGTGTVLRRQRVGAHSGAEVDRDTGGGAGGREPFVSFYADEHLAVVRRADPGDALPVPPCAPHRPGVRPSARRMAHAARRE